jgi:hypothetical protein
VYKVVPFQANISNTGSDKDLASGLQQIINQEAAGGWTFVQIQELTTAMAGSSGCFGLGATPGTTVYLSVLIFHKP